MIFSIINNLRWRGGRAVLGRGPRAFLIGKISDVNPEFGIFSEHSKLMIFSKLTKLLKVIHLESLKNSLKSKLNIISNSIGNEALFWPLRHGKNIPVIP